MKKIIFLSCVISSGSYAAELTSFAAAEAAVMTGHRISFVVDWEKCDSNHPEIKLDFASSWTPEGIVIHKGQYIAARGMSYTQTHNVNLPNLGPVKQAYDYIFVSGNGLKVINHFLDPVTYEEKMPAATLDCKLGEGFKIYSSAN